MDLTPPLDPAVLERVFGLYRLARMLFAAAALDVAGHLAGGPLDAAGLAARTATHAPALASLMDALAGWGVFARDEAGRYALTPFSQRLVRGAANAANVPLLLGWVGLPATYEAFGDLLHTIRTGESAFRARHGADFYAYLAQHPEAAQLYEAAMEATTDSFQSSAAAYDFSSARLIVDVGGGQGAFAAAILARYPDLRAVSFDLPDVIARAQAPDPAVAGRLVLAGGDVFQAVPAGGDIYVTSTVLRCFDDVRCLQVLRNIRAAMPAHARLAAFEMVMPEQRDNLALNTADLTARVLYGGRDRTEREFAELFAQAGLRHTRTLPPAPGGAISILEAGPA